MDGVGITDILAIALIRVQKTCLLQELGDELRKDEGAIEKDLVAARDFLEEIELKYRIPAWLDFLPGGRGIFKNLRL